MAVIRVRVGTREEGFDFDPVNGYYHEYIADAAEDLSSIPLNGTGVNKPRAGSLCLISGTKDVYVLSPARAWTILIEADPESSQEET